MYIPVTSEQVSPIATHTAEELYTAEFLPSENPGRGTFEGIFF